MKAISSSLLLVLLLSGMMIQPSHSLNDAQFQHICSRTVHYSSCMRVLKSSNRLASANHLRLLGFVVEFARSSAYANLFFIESMEREAIIPAFKRRYQNCSAHYASGVSLLNRAKQNLRLKDYGKVAERANSAMFKYVDCRNVFEDGKSVVDVHVRRMNEYMYNVCDTVVAVAREVAFG